MSVHARLVRHAHRLGVDPNFVLSRFAAERFLYRLSQLPGGERFILKGALLLHRWLGDHSPPTREIGLQGPRDLDTEGLAQLLIDVFSVAVEDDGIEFLPGSVSISRIRVDSPLIGFRAKFDARLWRTRLRHEVGIGLGDSIYPPAVEIAPGGLLGLPMAQVRAYMPYRAVAEKLLAIVERGEENSRQKD
jgi:hypothetical protein